MDYISHKIHPVPCLVADVFHKLLIFRQAFCVPSVLWLLGISRFHPTTFLDFPSEAVYDNAR